MRTLGNILWHFPFLGFLFAFCYAISGCFWCLTIVGIPLGMGLFQLSSFMLAPFNKALVSRSDLEEMTQDKQNGVMMIWRLIIRILYFPFGLIAAFGAVVTIAAEFLSILGIPCALVYAKALGAIFNPTGKVCVPRSVAEEIERRKTAKTLNKYSSPLTSEISSANVPNNVVTQSNIPTEIENKITLKSDAELEQILNNTDEYNQTLVLAALKEKNKRLKYVPFLQETPKEEPEIKVEEEQQIAIESPQPLMQETIKEEPKIEEKPSQKKNNGLIIGILVGIVLLVGAIIGYFVWYVPYATDRDAPRTYVMATNVFLRASEMAGVEYNILDKIPYGQEIITYEKRTEWSNVKVNGQKGYMSSMYLLSKPDFDLLHGIWGRVDEIEVVSSAKCRLAMLDFYKRMNLNSGSDGWQLFTNGKDNKVNTISYPRLFNKQSKYTDFVFIVKKQGNPHRYLAAYSFDDETEEPIFRFSTNVPISGNIRTITKNGNKVVVRLDTGSDVDFYISNAN